MRRATTAGLFTTGLLLLTAATGAIDAVSYLALDGVFTGNMTGNVLFLAFALVGVPGMPLLNNALALVGFVVGSILGGRLMRRGHPVGLPVRSAWLLGGGAALIAVLVVVWLVVGDLTPTGQAVLTAVLAALMGAQVAAVKPVGNTDITTVVVTSTLANVSRESRLGGGRQTPGQWRDRSLAVLSMGVGAAIGAAVLRAADGPVALAASGVLFTAGVAALLVARRDQRRRPRGSADVPTSARADEALVGP
ncbi:YoaK family protein [Cellulomonas sp. CW35]|uniref:YoaK family protein n=1 Tax=Cellulomonas sp. CW35 TaxID=3458249 RepID=UPI004033567E